MLISVRQLKKYYVLETPEPKPTDEHYEQNIVSFYVALPVLNSRTAEPQNIV